MRAIPLLLAIWFITIPACVKAQEEHPKKLIEYGSSDVPYPDFIEKNIRSMEKRPFDGIIFRLRGLNHAFELRRWNESELKPQMDALAAIKWRKFTDNFICLQSTDRWGMNWFDDVGWRTITANLRLVARAARIGHCVGICFDPEPYGNNPWTYSEEYRNRSFSDVEAQVRKRGMEFINALQKELPELRLLTFFQISWLKNIAKEPDQELRLKRLINDDYALLPAFLNGMLDALGPGARIIDGNEFAYYYTDSKAFSDARQFIKEDALVFIDPINREKYSSQVQVGTAIYMDHSLNLRRPEGDYLSYFLTPRERLRWLEHNVYYALKSTDEYAWCYGERLDWWRNVLPAGAQAAIRSARKKIASGRPLGFNIENIAVARQFYQYPVPFNSRLNLEKLSACSEYAPKIREKMLELRPVEEKIKALKKARELKSYVGLINKPPADKEKAWEAEKIKDLRAKYLLRGPETPEEMRLNNLKQKDPEMYALALERYELGKELKALREKLRDCAKINRCKIGIK